MTAFQKGCDRPRRWSRLVTTRWQPRGFKVTSHDSRCKEMGMPSLKRAGQNQGGLFRSLACPSSQSYTYLNKTLHASPRKHTLEGSPFPFPNNDLRERFGALLAQADAGMLRSMGVPENWREQALWKVRAP